MGKLPGIIPTQAFELVRNQIAFILADEIAYQRYLTSDNTLKMKVWVERFIPFDLTELPCVNVSLSNGQYSNKDAKSVTGAYTYNIDMHTSSKNMGEQKGDYLAQVKMQRLAGVIRAILENPIYRILDLPITVGITGVGFVDFNIADPKESDAIHTVMGRLTFKVTVPENVQFLPAIPLQHSFTSQMIGDSERGYYYGF